jgi:hypothetical protein
MEAKYYTTTKALELANQPKPKVEFVSGDNKIDVMIRGKHFTSYLYGDELTKPILFPVCTPSGVAVSRSYPFVKVAGESTDHPHHAGIFFTYDEVNDDGFWNNTTSPPQIKHVKVTEMTGGNGKGKLSTVMHWIGKSGQVLLEEKRNMVFHTGKNEYTIDFSIDLTAKDTKVIFSDTKEGMFAIRVADWLREKGGTGRYLNSNGEQTEKNVWGRRARWVCLQGEKGGKPIGIAIFNHPTSVNYPAYWHARGYGLFSANPLGQYAFERGRGQRNPQSFNLMLQAGETAHFEFRMITYEGTRTKEQLKRQFDEFVK